MALAVLGGGTPRELVAALAAGDTARLQAVPGIGKRTAERIVVELREKVGRRRWPALARAGRAGRTQPTRRRPAAAGPRRACSSSATRPPRPTRCCATPPATAPEELLQDALRAARRAA